MPSDKKELHRSIIDPDIEQEMFASLAPLPLAAETRGALLGRTLAKIRDQRKPSFVTVRETDGAWQEVTPGVFCKRLLDAPGRNASLYRMLPGSAFPAHQHPSDEECMCLEGEVDLGGILIHAGEFHLAPKGLPHGEIRTAEGCLLYIRCGAE